MRVRATLTCGWCAREIETGAAELVAATGRLLISRAPWRQPDARGRPVCAHCGGPLFIAGWESIRSRERLNPADFAPPRRGRPRRAVA